jgi:hypothetical protein
MERETKTRGPGWRETSIELLGSTRLVSMSLQIGDGSIYKFPQISEPTFYFISPEIF